MSGAPFVPDIAPGLAVSTTQVVVASAASPAVATFPLPVFGLFLCTLQALVNNDVNNQAVAIFLVQFYRGSSNILGRNVIGGPNFSSATSIGVNALTVNGPTTSSNFTASVGWTDAAAHPVTFNLTMRQIFAL